MTEAMGETETVSDNGLMIEIEEVTLLSEANLEVIIILEVNVIAEDQGSEVSLDSLPEDLELH